MDEATELRRRIGVVLVYLGKRGPGQSVDVEHIRQVLTRPEIGVGKKLS